MPIIESMIDQDFYKFSMMQAIFHRFPDVNVQYELTVRNHPGELLRDLIPKIESEINNLCTLRFDSGELDYLLKFPWITENFAEFLRLFQLNESYIKVYYDEKAGYYGNFRVTVRGSWLNTILFEVPVLAIVSELLSKKLNANALGIGIANLKKNVDLVRSMECNNDPYFTIADFGTRRRASKAWQDVVIENYKALLPVNFIGTSNVHFARKYDLTPIGTQAHEWFMAHQALTRVADSQKAALENWAQEYRGQLGIALTDTIGMDAFLRDFDLYFAKLFDGCRQDSGNTYEWTNKLLSHYYKNRIDPHTKTAVYSDKINFAYAIELYRQFGDQIKTSFGIGTAITNDVGIVAPQIVLKMTKCNGRPVAKISDSLGKSMCPDEDYVRYLRQQFGVS